MPILPILYRDRDLVICEKPAGMLSQPDALHPSDPSSDVITALSHQLAVPDTSAPELYLIHRLDRGVGGIMVFATNRTAAGKLSSMVAERSIIKQYIAVLHGRPEADEGILQDFLYKDSAMGKSYVVSHQRKGVKAASLSYQMLEALQDSPAGPCSLVKITLHTGRTHQIRVQFSSRGMPLIGDGKYGAKDHGLPLGLWSHRLSFDHPLRRGKTIDASSMPPALPPFSWFSAFLPSD